MVLVRGLSPNSATVVATRSKIQFGDRRKDVVEPKTPEAAQAAFAALFRQPGTPTS